MNNYCMFGNGSCLVVAEYLQKITFLEDERARLQKKLEEIENLSKYAWEQVDRNPEEAKELFKIIHAKSR